MLKRLMPSIVLISLLIIALIIVSLFTVTHQRLAEPSTDSSAGTATLTLRSNPLTYESVYSADPSTRCAREGAGYLSNNSLNSETVQIHGVTYYQIYRIPVSTGNRFSSDAVVAQIFCDTAQPLYIITDTSRLTLFQIMLVIGILIATAPIFYELRESGWYARTLYRTRFNDRNKQ